MQATTSPCPAGCDGGWVAEDLYWGGESWPCDVCNQDGRPYPATGVEADQWEQRKGDLGRAITRLLDQADARSYALKAAPRSERVAKDGVEA